MVLSLDYENVLEKKIQINWDFAKQQNDISCRLYLQFFVVCLTVAVSFTIATIVEKLDPVFIIPAGLFYIFTIYFILKLRSITKNLVKDYEQILDELDNLLTYD